MAGLKPIVPAGENEEVKLRVPPKKCAACGGKFIPHGKTSIYCPTCKKLPQTRREAMRDKRLLHPEEDTSEVKVYIDESLKKKKETIMKNEHDPFEPVTVTVTPEQIAEEMADQVTIAEEPVGRQQIIKSLASLLSESLGVEVLPFDEVEDIEIYVGTNRIFHGYAIARASK